MFPIIPSSPSPRKGRQIDSSGEIRYNSIKKTLSAPCRRRACHETENRQNRPDDPGCAAGSVFAGRNPHQEGIVLLAGRTDRPMHHCIPCGLLALPPVPQVDGRPGGPVSLLRHQAQVSIFPPTLQPTNAPAGNSRGHKKVILLFAGNGMALAMPFPVSSSFYSEQS